MSERPEDGFSLVEFIVASALMVVVLAMVSLATTTSVKVTRQGVLSGLTTGPAQLAAQEIQQIASGAFVPANAPSMTTNCANGNTGAAFPAGTGPFVSTADSTSTDLWLCSYRMGTQTSYTFEIHFTQCNSSQVCTLEVDQQGAVGCTSPCAATTVAAIPNVSDAGAPFTYDYYSSGTWTTASQPLSSAQLPAIQAIGINLSSPVTAAGNGNAATVMRTILLPNTLNGAS
ncbi:MAG TPA: prepilin-type N-terminal cleavage/methylation domain-containing protein [Acidimicrobiales bacterium]|nr:prepilin-type N-terminal cleavage/methylation domain-containing protein [Acidimicrobiales bacterium]